MDPSLKICKMCKKPQTIVQSHIFSNLLYKPVLGEHGQYIEIDPGNNRRHKAQGGIKEKLLCIRCETKRSNWENYAKFFLFDKKASKWNKVYRDLFLVSGINYSKLKLFVLSNLWMVSISNTIQRAEPTSLGMHEDTIRQMLLNETPGPKELYAVLFRKIKEKIGTGLMLADAIKQRLEGHTCYYMVFGGYAWYVIVTSHKLNQTIHRAILSEKGEALVSLMPIKETGAVEAVKHVHSVK